MRILLMCASLMLAPALALAQPGQITLPDFSALSKRAKQTTEVSLDAEALKSAGGLLGGNDGSEARSALGGLQGVYVRSYKFDRPNVYSIHDVEDVIRQADAMGWKKLVSVHGEDENVEIRSGGDKEGGMLIVAAKPLELTIVNIAGRIDLAKLGMLQGNLGVPRLPGPAGAPGSSAPAPSH